LSVKDVTGGKIDFSRTRFIPREEHEELTKRCKPEYFDILFTKVGTTGIARVIDTREEFSIFVSLALLKYPQNCIAPYFFELLLNSPIVRHQSAENTQGVGNKNLVLKSIKSFLVALPPLAEQQRIVAKVDELMRWCDALEARLTAAQTTAEHLLDATLHQILSAPREAAAEEPIIFSTANSLKKQISGFWPESKEDELFETRRKICCAPPREYNIAPTYNELLETSNISWMLGMTKDFRKSIREIDRKLQGRILDAINNISEAPVTPNGDTVKPLTGDMKDFWRYRIGDYRLVYKPNREKHQITLWTFAARGGVYE
jgi:addiction module RelE/StbE family toxin